MNSNLVTEFIKNSELKPHHVFIDMGSGKIELLYIVIYSIKYLYLIHIYIFVILFFIIYNLKNFFYCNKKV